MSTVHSLHCVTDKQQRICWRYARRRPGQARPTNLPGSICGCSSAAGPNKATGEMKQRVLEELHRIASGEKSPFITDLARSGRFADMASAGSTPEAVEEAVRRHASALLSAILNAPACLGPALGYSERLLSIQYQYDRPVLPAGAQGFRHRNRTFLVL